MKPCFAALDGAPLPTDRKLDGANIWPHLAGTPEAKPAHDTSYQTKRSTRVVGPGMTPEETGQFVIAKSTDDGVTWSKPANITAQVK